MGWDAYNYFPNGTTVGAVRTYLKLGHFVEYPRQRRDKETLATFFYYNNIDYKSISDLQATLGIDSDTKLLVLRTHSTLWRSKFDTDFHNRTIRELKQLLGGYFTTDEGRNRYFTFEGPVREYAEGGVFLAHLKFKQNIDRGKLLIKNLSVATGHFPALSIHPTIDAYNPRVVASNLLVPFLVATMEDLFRSSYIALLRYSDKKSQIIKNAQLKSSDMTALISGEADLIDVVARWMNFQDLKKASEAFKGLNNKHDIHGVLNRPYGRRKASLWDSLTALIKQRHLLIHDAQVRADYSLANIDRDTNTCATAIWKVYQHIAIANAWSRVEKSEF